MLVQLNILIWKSLHSIYVLNDALLFDFFFDMNLWNKKIGAK